VDLEPMPRIRRIEDSLGAIPAFSAAHPDRTSRQNADAPGSNAR